MPPKVRITREIGFCFGVKRALSLLEKAAQTYPEIDTLGALVHNEQVLAHLKSQGIDIINSTAEIKHPVVAISAHGVGAQVESELAAKNVMLIDTTCPDVKRAQKVVQDLAQNGFGVVVFGDAEHQEVKGLLGWSQGRGIAARDIGELKKMPGLPKRLGLLSQTTQSPVNFNQFARELVELCLADAIEIRIINTICPAVKKRQMEALALARTSDLMLVVGSRTSANSRRLFEICQSQTETHLVDTAADIDAAWLAGKKSIGVTSGTSTSQETIDAVLARLRELGADAPGTL
jgi:4-hydroxy-3-methylbut-2-en-1-yl diphosphate reductase